MMNGSNGNHSDHTIDAFGDWDVHGEQVALGESLVVAPARGRLRRGDVQTDAVVTRGTILGNVQRANGGGSVPVYAPRDGVLLGWLAWEGESVVAGALIAWIGSSRNGISDMSGNGNGDGHARGRKKPPAKA